MVYTPFLLWFFTKAAAGGEGGGSKEQYYSGIGESLVKFKLPCPYPKFIGAQPHSSAWALLSMAAFSLRQRGQTVAADTVRPTKLCQGESWPTHDLTLKT